MNEKSPMTQAKRGLIQLSGEDSQKFLQGQVTCNMEDLTPNQSIFGAHCSPKGRVIFLFCASMDKSQNIILDTHPSIVEIAIASLKKYAVFFKTEITDISDTGNSDTSYPSDLQRIELGQADVTVETTEMFIPQMLNLDILDYISFKKGCYTGQEVVARAHYRGAVKRRMHGLSLTCCSLPEPGEAIFDADNKPLGNIVTAAIDSDNHVAALAVVSEDALTCKTVYIAGNAIPVSNKPLPYTVP